jgi:hypothetical protein
MNEEVAYEETDGPFDKYADNMYCWVMCKVILIILMLSDRGHY